MRITLHKWNVGQDERGIWRERRGDKWVEIPKPDWANDPEPAASNVRELPTPMTDPYEREEGEAAPLVTVQRVVTRTVPDFEAEVLVRNGWEYQNGYNGCDT